MKYLVAYDIGDEKRLRHVARVCEDFGHRLQKSLFECELDEPRFKFMWLKLSCEMNKEEDALLAWPLCGSCENKSITLGVSKTHDYNELAIVC